MSAHAIPTFFLYGEPHQRVDPGFLHAERIDDRSRPSEWTIRPHTHNQLNHLFHIAEGSGTLRIEERDIALEPPLLLFVPARAAHGFAFAPETSGTVITLSDGYLAELAPLLATARNLFERETLVALPPAEAGEAELRCARVLRELAWLREGHRAALLGELLPLLVMAQRLSGRSEGDARASPQRDLVARLRVRIEESFREREPVGVQAAALGVSETRLRVACAAVAGRSPGAMLDDRTLLEARRALLYSTLTVAEIGYGLGFSDPAYFTRFFTKRSGHSPRTFRKIAAQSGAVG